MKQKPKVIVVCGPTATGKSDLGVLIAKNFNGEIISADSRQVYMGLDIGSGKITKKEMKGVPHYLLDIEDVHNKFSVQEFLVTGKNAVNNILKRKKVPIIVGGTGYYIDALINNVIFPEVPPNEKLRAKLEKKGLPELNKILEKLDKNRFEHIDKKNRVRLVRAIEVATALGKVPELITSSPYDTLFIGLDLDTEKLRERINDRLLSRIEQGMVEEVENLIIDGISHKRLLELGLEYRYITEYLINKISIDEMVEILKNKIWQFAKRQKLWFRRNKNINWFLPKKDNKKVLSLVEGFLN